MTETAETKYLRGRFVEENLAVCKAGWCPTYKLDIRRVELNDFLSVSGGWSLIQKCH